jgi:two-component system sensor histidine kinase SenX3
MWRRFRPPLLAVAAVLFALMAVLAGLQYHWLGQVSEAERERLKLVMTTGAGEFALDFDREITRAFLLFQTDGPESLETTQVTERFAARYDRWQATGRFPRLIKEFYFVQPDQQTSGALTVRRFDPARRSLDDTPWPESMKDWQQRFTAAEETSTSGSALFVRRMPPLVWETVPAIIVPTPMMFNAAVPLPQRGNTVPPRSLSLPFALSFSVLVVDLDYVRQEVLPALAARHFNQGTSGSGYRIAVIDRDDKGKPVFQSTPSFTPALDTRADADADLFQVRPQDFTALTQEVRQFMTFVAGKSTSTSAVVNHRFTLAESRPMAVVVQPTPEAGAKNVPNGSRAWVLQGELARSKGGGVVTTTRVTTSAPSAHWRLVVVHAQGSLEAAVASLRRRNLAISSSVLGLLGVSMGLLVLSTRRAQRLAKQQMEFVAAVSHELRTPLAVIRSAAENLADGVVHDDDRIRRYGELMSAEGRRLTEMVEQILELAGIQSGKRGFALRSVPIAPLLRDIVSSSSALIDRAGVSVELDLADNVPAVLGDELALRRVFQNLIDNAIKYGATGGWIKVGVRQTGSEVVITVADRGIGIAPADQARIFEPFYRAADVVAAQMQGAGLGLNLVQRIVVAHGGRVSVKSAPGAGSEFTVQLPAASDRPVAEGAAAPSTSSGQARSTSSGQVEAPRYS